LEREYAVRVRGQVSDEALSRLVNGVELEDGPGRFEEIVPAGGSDRHQWFHVLIVEGRNREVRRLWEAVGCTVSRLKRVRFGNVILGPRPTPGHWREVVGDELDTLLVLAGLDSSSGAMAGSGAKRRSAAGGAAPAPRPQAGRVRPKQHGRAGRRR
jgi:23S rRNA pseudouridine2605 synthase